MRFTHHSVLFVFMVFGAAFPVARGADCDSAQFKAAAPLCGRVLRCEQRYVANSGATGAAEARFACLQNAAAAFGSAYTRVAAKPPACANGDDPAALAGAWLARISGTGGVVSTFLQGWDGASVDSSRLYAKLLGIAAPVCGPVLKSRGRANAPRNRFVQKATATIRKAKRRGLNYAGAEPVALAVSLRNLAAAPAAPADPAGNPGTVPGPAAPGGNPLPPAANVNRGLSGTLRYARPFEGAELDLATGIVTAFSPAVGSPSLDGTELVDSSLDPLSGDDTVDEVRIFGRDGRTVVRFEVIEGRWRSPRLSPDHQRVVVGDLNNAYLFDRSGNDLATLENVENWSWSPDGRLYVVRGESLYIRSGAGLENENLIKAFPGQKPGIPVVSPDGARLAFQLGDPDGGFDWLFHIYTMNADGSGLSKVTSSTGVIDEGGPAWSPDGRFIIFNAPSRTSGEYAGIPGGVCPMLHAVPSDAVSVEIRYGEESGPSFPIKSLQKIGAGWSAVNSCAFSSPSWRPKLPDLPSRTGTAANSAALNSGLSGRMIYSEVGGDVILDLGSGSAAAAPFNEGYVSRDGAEVADWDFDNERVDILRLDGAPAARINDARLRSPIRFSPDRQRLALPWRPESDSVDQFDNITILRRDGTVTRRFFGYQSWDWLADGRLLMGRLTGGIDVSDPGLTGVQPLLALPDRTDGVSASNDGRQIAFALGGHIWMADSNGGGLHQLTVSGGVDTTPEFSPDGRFVAVRWKEDSDTPCGEIWVVPADGERVFIGNDRVPTGAVRLQKAENGKTTSVTCASGVLNWR